MTDDELDPSNDPTQERVRRLLAEARHDDPIPDDVARRLDSALAGLAAERGRESVVSLDAARRRRRRWTTGLVAAAAAVVVGVSLPSLTGGLSGISADSDDSAGSAGESSADMESREFSSSSPEEDSGGGSDGAQAPSDSTAPLVAPAEVDPGRFKQDAQAARDGAAGDTAGIESRPAVCGDVPGGAEQVVPVRYDEQDGYLVFEPAAGGKGAGDRQRVTLFLCPGGVPARQALVPGP